MASFSSRVICAARSDALCPGSSEVSIQGCASATAQAKPMQAISPRIDIIFLVPPVQLIGMAFLPLSQLPGCERICALLNAGSKWGFSHPRNFLGLKGFNG